MIKNIYLTILSLLAGVGFFAQNGTVRGTVSDDITGETLIGATVVYSKGKGTTTDYNGSSNTKLPKLFF